MIAHRVRRWIAIGAATIALAVAGCGERPQVINYKQGKYQGKPDTPAYSSAPFNGNKQQWDNAIDTRTQDAERVRAPARLIGRHCHA